MEGTRISHYEVLERLGGGGMGVVHKAVDEKLGRHVALKLLPREMTREEEARFRFVQEARAASALDHPNICTIYEIDTSDDGQMFIAMAYYEGETLKTKLERGALPVEDAVDVAVQIARGLAKAHDAGIVHRDIKPANVIVTGDGLVKILDFGIAKLLGVTGPTRDGSTLGTVSYMSPEQVDGAVADARSDVWALGVVLYEMLAGRPPFSGENQWAVMNSILNREPEPVRTTRPDVSSEVADAIAAALRKDRDERLPSADAFAGRLEASTHGAGGKRPGSAPAPGTTRASPMAAAAVVGLVAALGLWAATSLGGAADERMARAEGLPELLAYVDEGDFEAAFALGRELEEVIPNDPVLRDAMESVSVTTTIATEPAGAEVYIRPYDPEAAWQLLGPAPVEGVRWARGEVVQLRVEAPGRETRVLASGAPGFYFARANPETIELPPAGSVPEDMVYVPAGRFRVQLTGFQNDSVALDAFLLDRNEVTNAQFKEFVDAGGYEEEEYWEGLDFVREGRRLSWGEAMASMVDATGRRGPAGWESGTFPSGEADHPVTGVSWYEAVAYTRFRGKALPTVYHWARAAVEPHTFSQGFPSAMLRFANFRGVGTLPVGSSGAMGPNGTFDMAGNVKEWLSNTDGSNRWLLGGGWEDDHYMYSVRFTAPPFDRSSQNGIRGAIYPGGPPAGELSEPVPSRVTDGRLITPVSDEEFERYRNELRHLPSRLDAEVLTRDPSHPDWTYERVSLSADAPGERFDVHLFTPSSARATPPYQTLIYFMGIGGFQQPGELDAQDLVDGSAFFADDLIRSGRALAVPVWSGSFERWDDFLSRRGDQGLRAMGEHVRDWASELGRTIDYLESRPEFDPSRIGYYGASFGASTALPLLGLEGRLRMAVLLLGGYPSNPAPPAAHPVNYAPRITMPVLMLNGTADFLFSPEVAARPFFELLGTPAADKDLRLYEIGHQPPPRGPFLADVIPWLDDYLGPVD